MSAQNQNWDFENITTTLNQWTNLPDTLLENWSGTGGICKASSESCTGKLSASIQNMFGCGISPGTLINGTTPYGGMPVNGKPTSVSGHYKFLNTSASDSAGATVILKKYNATLGRTDTVGYGTTILLSANSYIGFKVNITDLKPGVVPDSIVIIFTSMINTDWQNISFNPILYIDAISISEDVMGIHATNENNIANVYPNPFSGSFTIELPSIENNVQLTVMDIQGKTIINSTMTGMQKTFSAENLPDGIYMYKLTSGSKEISKGKLIKE